MVELYPAQSVLPSRVEARLSGPDSSPGYPVAGVVEAAEWTLQALYFRQHPVLGYPAVLKHQLTGHAGLEGVLARHLGSRESGVALLDYEAANHAVELGPDNRKVGDGAVGYPHLGTVEQVVVALVLGAGNHVTGIRAVVGFGQAEASYPLSSRHPREIVVLLLLASEVPYRVHRQRALNACEGAHAAVTPLQLLAD